MRRIERENDDKRVIDFLARFGSARVCTISRALNISSTVIHNKLQRLVAEGKVLRDHLLYRSAE